MTLMCKSPMKERRQRRRQKSSFFMLQAEAVESRCRNDSGPGALEETSREEMCPPNKLRVRISGLCFKMTLILYFSQRFLREAQSLEVNVLRISPKSIGPSQLSFLLMN